MAASFAILSEVAMATLGSRLKRREKISGRFADAFAWIYLGSAALLKFENDGRPSNALPFALWAGEHALYRVQTALQGILDNLPNRLAALVLRPILFPFGARLRPPSDDLGTSTARGLLEDREARRCLTADIYMPSSVEPGLGRLEEALDMAVDALAMKAKIRDAVRAGRLNGAVGDALLDQAVTAGILSVDDRDKLREADEAREEVIQVDAFDQKKIPLSRN
jgi:acyl-CoA dehydrogenase